MSLNLRAIVSQRLVPGVDGKRVAALEILLDTPWAKDLIKQGQVDALKEAMEKSTQEGGQTFDQALFDLYAEGRISEAQALANADSANNLRIRIKNVQISGRTAREQRFAAALGPSELRIEGTPAASNLRRP